MNNNFRIKYSLALYTLLFAFSFSSFGQFKKTLYIADRAVLCGDKDCMQVKEKKKDTWNVFTDSIKGFTYEEGYEYKITADHSVDYNTWKLIKVVSKKKTHYNPAVKLEGKKWVLVSMFDNANTMSLGDTTVFIKIDITNGKVSGHGVCNQLKGKANATAGVITFSDLGFTKMKCIDQGNIMEAIVTNLLEATATYTLKGTKLTLYSAKGSNMVFKQQ